MQSGTIIHIIELEYTLNDLPSGRCALSKRF